MALSRLFHRESSGQLIFELFAAVGLALNALVMSNEAPISGEYLLASSIFLFGFGAIGLAIMYALPHADANQQNLVRPVIAIYGGLILAIVSSTAFAAAVAFTEFNNLFAILLLSGFSFMYVSFWRRLKTYKRSDLWFHTAR